MQMTKCQCTLKSSVYRVKSSISNLTTGLIWPPVTSVTSTESWISFAAVSTSFDASAWRKHAHSHNYNCPFTLQNHESKRFVKPCLLSSCPVSDTADIVYRAGCMKLTSVRPIIQLPRTLTTWHCPHSSAAAAAIDLYLLRVCYCGPMLVQTDGRTPYCYIDPPPGYTAASANNISNKIWISAFGRFEEQLGS